MGTAPTTREPGWYEQPGSPEVLRWHDGSSWTARTRSRPDTHGSAATSPHQASPQSSSARPAAEAVVVQADSPHWEPNQAPLPVENGLRLLDQVPHPRNDLSCATYPAQWPFSVSDPAGTAPLTSARTAGLETYEHPVSPPLTNAPLASHLPEVDGPVKVVDQWARGPRITMGSLWASTSTVSYAHWGWRVLSLFIDVFLMFAPAALVVYLLEMSWGLDHPKIVIDADTWIHFQLTGLLVFLTIWAVNRCLLQGLTGRSVGRMMTRTRLITAEEQKRPGVFRSGARDVAGVLNTLPLLLGWLWPLWDEKRQTFVDKMAGTVVER